MKEKIPPKSRIIPLIYATVISKGNRNPVNGMKKHPAMDTFILLCI